MLQNSLTRILPLLLFIFIYNGTQAQDVPSTDSVLKDAPMVFVDCQFCDLDYVRQQIPYVNYVRDRKASNVHVLVTQQNTGSGGKEYVLAFYGQSRFAGMSDTLTVNVGPNATNDEKRASRTRVINMGLMRYIAKTDLAAQITIDYAEDLEPTTVEDPWNNWVFSLDASAWFNGESSHSNLSSWSSVNIDKVTPELKIEIGGNMNYGENRFDVDDTTTITTVSRSHSGFARTVFSINDHFSWGVTGMASTSLYSNQRLSANLYPGFEYNLFPYAESTRHQLRMYLNAGPIYKRYYQVTIFEKTEELLWEGALNIAYKVQEKWGSVSAGLNSSGYINDISKHRLTFNTNLNLRLFKGFSFRLSGRVELIRDQINLPLAGASPEEILLRQRQLATGYNYWGNAGFTYTFGSVFNTVVNPRLGQW
jgi:hypothetical protein